MSESTTPAMPEEPDQQCTRCRYLKPATEFHWTASGNGVRRRRGQCRACRAATRGNRKGERKSPKKPSTPEEKRREALRSYGITEEQYEAMRVEQGGGCAICGAPYGDSITMRRLSIDHCHRSGRVRALLCGLCNRTLGHYETIREQAEKYLAQYGEGNPLLGYDATD